MFLIFLADLNEGHQSIAVQLPTLMCHGIKPAVSAL